MPTGSFSWLHLTDLHYGLKGQGHLWPTLREPFLESLGPLHDRCGPWDAVLFTGDLVQSGKSEEFERMQAEFLDPLWKRLGELGSGGSVLLAVPGNHDGVIRDSFAAYKQWWEQAPHLPSDVKTGILPGDFSVSLDRIGIVGLNTTFLQLAGGDCKGRLVWDARQLHAVCEEGVDVWSKQHDVAAYASNLAALALDREQWKEAERLARKALKLTQEIGRKEMIATHCWRLAKALARQGRGVEGVGHAERAVAIFSELRSPELAGAQVVLQECLG